MTTILGAALAGAAVACVFGALAVKPTQVARRLALFGGARDHRGRWRAVRDDDLRQSGLGWSQEQLLGMKVAAALALSSVGAAASLVLPFGPAVALALAYGGFITPSLVVERAARARRAAAAAAFTSFVERVEALMTSGRPAESAIATLALRPSGSELLDSVLRSSAEAASLGAPIFRALAAHAAEARLTAARIFAEDLERSRGLGRGSLAAVAETRSALRSGERARSLDAASRVEGKLMLVLVLCYLPALMLLVVVPLFIGLLDGLAT